MSRTAVTVRGLVVGPDDPPQSEPRTFRNMEKADLGIHVLRHLLRPKEDWAQVDPEVARLQSQPDVRAFLKEGGRRLFGPSWVEQTSWRTVEGACGAPERWNKFEAFAAELVNRFPALCALYADAVEASVRVAGPEPTHCKAPHDGEEKEYYIDRFGVFVSLAEDREPSPNHSHLALTGFRDTKGRLPEERRLERIARVRRNSTGTFYSERNWTGG